MLRMLSHSDFRAQFKFHPLHKVLHVSAYVHQTRMPTDAKEKYDFVIWADERQ